MQAFIEFIMFFTIILVTTIIAYNIIRIAANAKPPRANETRKQYFDQQKNMHYDKWKNPYNMQNNFPECLAILGFTQYPESSEEIKARYREKARKMHPDMGGSTEEFRKLNKAYTEALELPKYKTV